MYAYMNMKEFDKALIEFKTAEKLFPGYVQVYLGLGIYYGIKLDKEKSGLMFDKAMDIANEVEDERLMESIRGVSNIFN